MRAGVICLSIRHPPYVRALPAGRGLAMDCYDIVASRSQNYLLILCRHYALEASWSGRWTDELGRAGQPAKERFRIELS
jgi:hypothetical protein